jgi:hypothetical protein
MSLIPFHRFLIAAAIIFCGGFAVWAFLAFLDDSRLLNLGLAIAFGAAAVGLGYYLKNLARFLNLSPDERERSSSQVD